MRSREFRTNRVVTETIEDYGEGLAVNANVAVTGTLTVTGTILTDSDVGAANTGVTAVEYGDGVFHRTVLTVDQDAAFTLADNASIADGYLLYTFPAGDVAVHSAVMSLTVTNAEHDTEACDFGLGTTIGTGAVATLDGTPGFENIMTGQTAAVGTAEQAAVNTVLMIPTASPHIVHANVAAAWADTAGTALDADLAGYVVLEWSLLS